MELSKDVLFDKRLIDRHIRLGLITPKQVQEHLSQLPDMSEAGESLDLEEAGAGVLDDRVAVQGLEDRIVLIAPAAELDLRSVRLGEREGLAEEW